MHYIVDSLSAMHAKHMWIHYECHFHTIYHIPYSIYHIPKWSHWPKYHEYFFRKTALADSIFTLYGGSARAIFLKKIHDVLATGTILVYVYGIWYVVYSMKMAFTVYLHMFHMCHAQAVYNIVHIFLVN